MKKNKERKKKHNNWFYVIFYSLIEFFTMYSTTGSDAYPAYESLIEADDHLGEIGKKRHEKLIVMSFLFIGLFFLYIFVSTFENQTVDILGIIFSILMIIPSLIYLIRKK